MDRIDVERGAATEFASPDVVCRARPQGALESLGPVLLVRRGSGGAQHGWHVGSEIDAYGVREFLQTAHWRLYRLPDSDFLGWERLAQLCRPLPCHAPPEPPSALRCASVACYAVECWREVETLSPVGRELVRTLLRLESAHLCRAAWQAAH